MFPAIGYTAEQYRNVESIPEIQSEVMSAKLPYSKAKMYLNTVKTEISRVNGTLMDGSFRVVMTWTIQIITSSTVSSVVFYCFVQNSRSFCLRFLIIAKHVFLYNLKWRHTLQFGGVVLCDRHESLFSK